MNFKYRFLKDFLPLGNPLLFTEISNSLSYAVLCTSFFKNIIYDVWKSLKITIFANLNVKISTNKFQIVIYYE